RCVWPALLGLLGCSELDKARYADLATAEEAGAISRGWLPADLPHSARDIREAHDLDTNEGWVALRFDPATPVDLGEWTFIPWNRRAAVRLPDPPVDWWAEHLRPPWPPAEVLQHT